MEETRVLQVLSSLGRGGIELWLLRMLRELHSHGVRFDLAVPKSGDRMLVSDFEALDARVHWTPACAPTLIFAREFSGILRRTRYDCVHAHGWWRYGIVLALAGIHGVKNRIIHAHNTRPAEQVRRSSGAKAVDLISRKLMNVFATRRVGCSAPALEAMFGRGKGPEVVYCGVDVPESRRTSAEVRASLGLRTEDFVVCTVGRIGVQKNHEFLVGICRAIMERGERAMFLVVGDGPRRAELEMRISDAGLEKEFVLAGVREDVGDLLRASDVFVFPSLFEGLGLAAVEAQAVGLPCVVSSAVPHEAAIDRRLWQSVSLADGADVWAERILEVRGRRRPEAGALEVFYASPFSLGASADGLKRLYGLG